MPRKTLRERCVTTLKSMKTRAKKDGAVIEFTAADLETRIPADCIWCKRRLTPAIVQMDHLLPVSRGGSYALDNLLGICEFCNRKKGTLDAAEYRALLRKLSELTEELDSDYVAKDVLRRMGAGGAFVFRR